MIDKVTFWTDSGYDEDDIYAPKEWTAPVTVMCEYLTGGSMQRDIEGVEFQPMSSIYSVEPIPFSARIVLGESNSATPPDNAEVIRKTGTGTSLRFQSKEYESFTG